MSVARTGPGVDGILVGKDICLVQCNGPPLELLRGLRDHDLLTGGSVNATDGIFFKEIQTLGVDLFITQRKVIVLNLKS